MPNQKSLTEFLTFLKNITRKSISKLDRVTNFRLLRSTETSLLIGWNLPMSLENNRHAFHKLYLVSELHGRFDDADAVKPHADTFSSYVFYVFLVRFLWYHMTWYESVGVSTTLSYSGALVPSWTWFLLKYFLCFRTCEIWKILSGEVLLNYNSLDENYFWWNSTVEFLPGKPITRSRTFKYAIVRTIVMICSWSKRFVWTLNFLKRTKRGFLVTIKDVKARLQIQRKIIQRNIGFRNLKSGSTYEISVRALKESIQTT